MPDALERLNQWLDDAMMPDALEMSFMGVRIMGMPAETARKLAAKFGYEELLRAKRNARWWSEASMEDKLREVMISLEDPARVPLKRYESPLRYSVD